MPLRRYRFDVHHYGPFCVTILGDLEWLAADEAIVDKSPDPKKYSKFVPGPACDELIAMYAARFEQYKDAVIDTVKALLPLKPEHLELIATLDYSYRDVKSMVGKKPSKKKVIERFREFKGERFASKEISETFDRLERVGLFD